MSILQRYCELDLLEDTSALSQLINTDIFGQSKICERSRQPRSFNSGLNQSSLLAWHQADAIVRLSVVDCKFWEIWLAHDGHVVAANHAVDCLHYCFFAERGDEQRVGFHAYELIAIGDRHVKVLDLHWLALIGSSDVLQPSVRVSGLDVQQL